MNVIANDDNRTLLIRNDPRVISVENPLQPSPVATGIIRGVTFVWEAQPDPTRTIYFKYRTKVGAGAWGSWIVTWESSVTRWISPAEITLYGANAVIYLEVKSYDVFGNYSDVGVANAACLYFAVIGPDLQLESIPESALGPGVVSRIFSTNDMFLDELTEHGAAYFASESGADVTASHTAGDTALVNGVAAAIVQAGAANGATAQAKLAGEVGALIIETTVGSQAKVDARLSVAERANLVADKTVVGAQLLYHVGNKPTKTDVGLANVSNYSPANQIVNGLVKAHITGAPVLLVAADIDAIDIDLSNAPAGILNTTVTMAADGTLGGAGGGQVTPTGLGLGNVENKSSATIRGEITLANVAATGIDLDDIPNGTTYARTPTAQVNAIIRSLWVDNVFAAIGGKARTDLTTFGIAGATYSNVIVLPYIKRASESSITIVGYAEINDVAEGGIKLALTDYADVEKASGELLFDTGGIYTKKSVSVDLSGLVNDEIYILLVQLKGTAGDSMMLKGVQIYAKI